MSKNKDDLAQKTDLGVNKKTYNKQVKNQMRLDSVQARAQNQKRWLVWTSTFLIFTYLLIITVALMYHFYMIKYLYHNDQKTEWTKVLSDSIKDWKQTEIIVFNCLVIISAICILFNISNLLKFQGKMLWNIWRYRKFNFFVWLFIAIFAIPLNVIVMFLAIYENGQYIKQKAMQEVDLNLKEQQLQKQVDQLSSQNQNQQQGNINSNRR